MSKVIRALTQADIWLASLALVLMALIPLVEILSRPMMGKGVDNAPVVVQHLGLLMAMTGAIAAERFYRILGRVMPRAELPADLVLEDEKSYGDTVVYWIGRTADQSSNDEVEA